MPSFQKQASDQQNNQALLPLTNFKNIQATHVLYAKYIFIYIVYNYDYDYLYLDSFIWQMIN